MRNKEINEKYLYLLRILPSSLYHHAQSDVVWVCCSDVGSRKEDSNQLFIHIGRATVKKVDACQHMVVMKRNSVQRR